MFGKLALKSLMDRKGSVLLALIAMTVSIFVLLGVEHIRHQAKANFSSTVSGIDLIVGAKTGSINLLLYSVFRIGAPTNNISWEAYQHIANDANVEWAIPISLGDSHKGYRVLGTTTDYFKHFRYGKQHALAFDQGKPFDQVLDVVLGATVARELGYQLGDRLVVAHGVAQTSFSLHDDKPFEVVGILEPTGTPVDQTLHVSLAGIEAIHVNWQAGTRLPISTSSTSRTGNSPTTDVAQHAPKFKQEDLQPKSITAFMLGLKSKMVTFRLQRKINNTKQEPMLAILPGVALSELWQMLNVVENTLRLVSILVFAAACLGVSAVLLSSIRERAREIHLLRTIGAPPGFIFLLIELEALIITVSSIVLGALLLMASLYLSKNYLITNFGIHVDVHILSESSLMFCATMLVASAMIAIIPSLSGYATARR